MHLMKDLSGQGMHEEECMWYSWMKELLRQGMNEWSGDVLGWKLFRQGMHEEEWSYSLTNVEWCLDRACMRWKGVVTLWWFSHLGIACKKWSGVELEMDELVSLQLYQAASKVTYIHTYRTANKINHPHFYIQSNITMYFVFCIPILFVCWPGNMTKNF
jgi:hypothetical protein